MYLKVCGMTYPKESKKKLKQKTENIQSNVKTTNDINSK